MIRLPPRSTRPDTLFPAPTRYRSRAVAAEQGQRALGHVQRQNAAAGALLVHDQVDREVLDEEFGVVRQRLLVQGVQDRVAGTVGGGAGALRSALAVLGGRAAERKLVDLAFLGAREPHALVPAPDDRSDRREARVLDHALVTQTLRPAWGVAIVVAPG